MSNDQIVNVVQIQIASKKHKTASHPAHMLNFRPDRAKVLSYAGNKRIYRPKRNLGWQRKPNSQMETVIKVARGGIRKSERKE